MEKPLPSSEILILPHPHPSRNHGKKEIGENLREDGKGDQGILASLSSSLQELEEYLMDVLFMGNLRKEFFKIKITGRRKTEVS